MVWNCPHCNGLIGQLNVGLANAVEVNGKTWKAAVFTCPSCRKILGAGFDQTAHSQLIIDEIGKLLSK
jgi:uncharacterized protein with PIN domain